MSQDTPADVHEEPRTAYERMLDRNDMDCSIYGCWQPMRAFVREGDRRFRYCEVHAREIGTLETTEWLES